MRTADDHPLGPEIEAALAAIDATLSGDAVDPSHAEFAELALILTAERPQPTPSFTHALDRRLAARFTGERRRRPGRRWLFAPAAGLAAAMSIAVVVVLGSIGSGPASSSSSSASATNSHASERNNAIPRAGSLAAQGAGAVAATPSAAKRAAPTASGSNTTASSSAPGNSSSSESSAAPSSSGGSVGSSGSGVASSSGGSAGSSGSGVASSSSGSAGSSSNGGLASPSSATAPGTPLVPGTQAANPPDATAPAPTPNGRKIVQSAQLTLNAPANRIEDVAQEVFNVVGNEQGIVNRSTVTATGNPDGYAEFQLSVPSSSLSAAMTALSRLRYASVSSRTDATQDVNGQFNAATRRLADARALRTSLLKQLGAAVTQTQIDSLKSQIHDAEASISSDQAALGRLNHQINYSQISLTISAVALPPVASGSSFTIGRAAHDARRVLTVAAGVALIALAALVPLALLGAAGWWLGSSVRRRRREQALDLA
jgi:hypothetical protein